MPLSPPMADLTWEEFHALDKSRLIVILPVGATEAHGPHLPLATDVIIAEAMAREGARKLRLKGVESLILPPFAYSAAPFAAGFPGTVSLRPETASALLVDVGRSLAAHGVAVLAIANAHLDPTHLRSLHAGIAELQADGRLQIVFPDLTRKPWALRLTDEFKSGACHAGRFEGSIVLAERPELVRESIRAALPPNPVSLSTAIREGKTTFEAAGGPRAYFGAPAEAGAEEGRRTIDTLGAILEEAVVAALPPRA